MNEYVSKYLKLLKRPKILMILGITGMILVLITSFGGSKKETESLPDNSVLVEEYKKCLEEDIKETVKAITGSKNISVIITLESGIKYSYADTREESLTEKQESQNKTSDSAFKDGYIIVRDADGGEKALLVTAEMPEVRGVSIVCDGGDNEYIFEKIQNVVTAALDIKSGKVYICGRNSQ